MMRKKGPSASARRQPTSLLASGEDAPSYKPEYSAVASKLRERGFGDEDIAGALGVSMSTLRSWKVAHEEFLVALRRTREQQNALVENALLRSAHGYEYEAEKVLRTGERIRTIVQVPPNPAAARLWLATHKPEAYGKTEDVDGGKAGLWCLMGLTKGL